MEKLRNSFLDSKVRKVDEKNFEITHTVNTKTLDRYNTIVLPKGADIKNFNKNPTVLWSHNGDSTTTKIPIAKCISLTITDKEVEVTTKFNENDPLAMKIFAAFKDGFLNAWSIGFIPKKHERYTEDNVKDLNQTYGLAITKKAVKEAGWYGIYVIYEWELLEYSAVATPANPDALNEYDDAQRTQELVTRGLCTAADVRTLGELKQEPVESVETVKLNPNIVKSVEKSKDVISLPEKIENDVEKEDEVKEGVLEDKKRVEESEQRAKEEADKLFAEKLEKEKEIKEQKEKRDSEEVQSLREEVESLKEKNLQLTKRLDVYLETSEACTKEVEEKMEKLEKVLKAVLKSLEVDNIDNLSLLVEKGETKGRGSFVSSLLSRK